MKFRLWWLSLILLGASTSTRPAFGLNSCKTGYPTQVSEFKQGASGTPIAPAHSDPVELLGGSGGASFLSLGVGGSVTFMFDPPVANYPAAGSLAIQRPPGSPGCAASPERAEVAVSQDGIHFTSLGTICSDATFDVAPLPWATFVRISDVTDPSDPAFGGVVPDGFDIAVVSGPVCLKSSHCAVAAAPNPAVSSEPETRAVALPPLATDLLAAPDAVFQEYGNGTARFEGTLYRAGAPSETYYAILSFNGRVDNPPAGSPNLELDPSAYVANGGSVSPSTWYYYKTWSGKLFGGGAFSGQEINVSRSGPAFQVGTGANGRNRLYGASGAFQFAVPASGSKSTGQVTVNLVKCTPTPSATATPTATPSPTPTSIVTAQGTATPTPTAVSPVGPKCNSKDLRVDLLRLDGLFVTEKVLVGHATRILIAEKRTERNEAFRRESLRRVTELSTKGWSLIWSYPQTITQCDTSVNCVTTNVEPVRASIQAASSEIDQFTSRVLMRVRRLVTSARGKRAIESLIERQKRFATEIRTGLSGLPGSSVSCS